MFINRGNHEDIAINMSRHFDPNFKKDTELKFNRYSLAIFNRSQELFRNLPLATVIENSVGFKVFVTHGGISKNVDFRKIASRGLKRSNFDVVKYRTREGDEMKIASQVITDLLWSDPIPIDDKKSNSLGTRFNENRGAGCLFDQKLSDEFCQKNGFNCIVRSHECRQNGFTHDQPFCFTVFSVSNYCNGNNKAAVLYLDDKAQRVDFHDFQIEETNQSFQNDTKKFVLTTFKSYIDKKSSSLIKYFKEADTQNKGSFILSAFLFLFSLFLI